MSEARREQFAHLALLMVLGAALFGVQLGAYELWAPDEPRFAQVAREMRASGDPIVLRVNNEPYAEKPPLFIWGIALSSLYADDITETAARLPSVFGALLAVICTYLLAASLFGTRIAFWSCIVLMTCIRFWYNARYAQIDMLLTGCLSLSLLALWRWDLDRRARWLILFYGGMAAGLMAKGPPALVFPLFLLWAFYWGNPEARRATHWIAGTLASLVPVLLWFIPARLLAAPAAGAALETGIADNLFRNTIGRMFLGVSKAQPPWYYLENLPIDLLPWSLFLPWTLYWMWRNRRASRGMRYLLCGVLPALIFFSIVIGKRAIYILPLYPLFAVLLAASISDLMQDARRGTWRRRTGIAWGVLLVIVGLAPAAVYFTEYRDALDTRVTGLGFFAFLAGCYALRHALAFEAVHLHRLIAVQFGLLLFFTPFSLFPVVNTFKSAKDFCAPVRELSESGADFDLYSVAFSREEYVFYAKHYHQEIFTDLIDLGYPPDVDWRAVARKQKELQDRIGEAAEAVPVADIESVTPEERAALRAAILETAAEAEAEFPAFGEDLLSFKDALVDAVNAFAGKFDGPGPAMLFVRDEDWRWMLPLMDPLPGYEVVRHNTVGSRFVLLLANAGGTRLLEERGIE